MPDLADCFVFVQVKHIDTKLHEEAMNCLTRHDPEAFAIGKGRVFEQPVTPGFARIRNNRGGGQYLSLGLISHNDFQSLVYNTAGGI